jgi:hypothetical protein
VAVVRTMYWWSIRASLCDVIATLYCMGLKDFPECPIMSGYLIMEITRELQDPLSGGLSEVQEMSSDELVW